MIYKAKGKIFAELSIRCVESVESWLRPLGLGLAELRPVRVRITRVILAHSLDVGLFSEERV